MKKLLSTVALALVAALLLATPSDAQKPGKMKLVYKPGMGDTLKYRVTVEGDTAMTANNRTESEKMNVVIAFEQTVLHLNKETGNADLQITIKEARAKGSDGKTTDLAETIGKTVYATMKPSGEMLGVTSFDPNFDPNQMSVPFPDKPIGPGDSWTQSVKAGAQVPVPIEAKYTLAEFTEFKGRKVAVIDEDIRVPEAEKKNGISARTVGKLYFDYEKGILLRNHLRMEMTMNTELRNDDPKLGPPAKKVSTKVKMTTKMELED